MTHPKASFTEQERLRLGDPYQASEDERASALAAILRSVPDLMAILTAVRDLNLSDAWLVSGGIYQTTWNVLTGRSFDHGIKDYDIIYFDGSDLSYEAEDRIIKEVDAALPHLADKLETRNQARVHLWYEERFGSIYQPLTCSIEALTNYASKTHAVAARLTGSGAIEIRAPFGLSNLFAMRMVPNFALDNRKTHEEKSRRMAALWPELSVVAWDRDRT